MYIDNDISSMYPSTVFAPHIPKMSFRIHDRIFGKVKFYIVAPVFCDWIELEAWAVQTYGNPADVWDLGDTSPGRYYMNNSMFYFRDESDRTVFMLRWS